MPTCRSGVMMRSRVIEIVLEAIKLKCRNAEYGCHETMSLSKKNDHEKTCLHAPCSMLHAPCLNCCAFLGSSIQLYAHFTVEHNNSVYRFTYRKWLGITLHVNDSFVFFREVQRGHLFKLSNNVTGEVGNIISVSPIGSSLKRDFFSYQLRVKKDKSNLKYKYTRTRSSRGGLDSDDCEEGCFFLESQLFRSSKWELQFVYLHTFNDEI